VGAPPTDFVLEGGLTPGSVLASIPMGLNPIYSFEAPTGAFYIRVHTVAGAARSAASNEVRIFVNVPQPPSAPANLLGAVNGTTLHLAWRNTYGGGAPTGLILDVTGAVTISLPLGLGDSFTFAGVPPGTYTLSLRAVNAGGVSASSNAVTLVFPQPCSEAPSTPANFLAYRIGNLVHLVWDSAADGGAPTGYMVNVSGAFTASVPVPARSISGFVGPGTYNFSVLAANACGASAATPVQTIVVP
jgi:hypothetical protein